MSFKLTLILNNYSLDKSIQFKNNIFITKIYPYHNLLDVLFLLKNNFIRAILYLNNDVIFDTSEIKLPKKMYKLYNYKDRTLYTHCIELDDYLVGIDVMKIYKIKYFSSFFIMKKSQI